MRPSPSASHASNRAAAVLLGCARCSVAEVCSSLARARGRRQGGADDASDERQQERRGESRGPSPRAPADRWPASARMRSRTAAMSDGRGATPSSARRNPASRSSRSRSSRAPGLWRERTGRWREPGSLLLIAALRGHAPRPESAGRPAVRPHRPWSDQPSSFAMRRRSSSRPRCSRILSVDSGIARTRAVLLDAQPHEVAEGERRRVARGDLAEHRADPERRRGLGLSRRRLGRRDGGAVLGTLVEERRERRSLRAAMAQPADGAAVSDAEEPRTQEARLLERGQRPPCGEQDVLDDVVRRVEGRRRGQAAVDPQERRRVRRGHLLERADVACPSAFDDRLERDVVPKSRVPGSRVPRS